MIFKGLRFLFTDFHAYLHKGGKQVLTPIPKDLLRNPPQGKTIGFSTLLQPDGDVVMRGPSPQVLRNADDWDRYLAIHEGRVKNYLKGIKQSINAIVGIFLGFASAIYTLAVVLYESDNFASRNVPLYFHALYIALLLASFIVPGWKDFVRRLIMSAIFWLLGKLGTSIFKRVLLPYIRKKLFGASPTTA